MSNKKDTSIYEENSASKENISRSDESFFDEAVVTALSFRCCDQLMRDKALSVIYRVVNYSNRSLPWISIKEVALDILLNLAKCPTTYKGVYDHPSSTTIILDQMSNYRDKKCLIFSKACNLLTILCHDDDIKLDIKNTKKISQKVLSFYSLLNRKKQLDAHRQVQKEKKKDLFNGNAKWHRRTSAINTEDPFTAIHLLINALEIAVNV